MYLLTVYLEAQDSCNTLAFSWISSATDVGLWNIRVSQILCGDPNKRELLKEQDINTLSQLTLYAYNLNLSKGVPIRQAINNTQ